MKTEPHPSLCRSWLEIDLGAIRHNVGQFRRLAGRDGIVMPCLKADAYGHGMVEAACAALAGGASRLAVATCLEGERLRSAGVEVPIQILGSVLPGEIAPAIESGLTLSLHDAETARLASAEAVRLGKTVTAHLKIDSGMGRLGMLPEDVPAAARLARSLPGLVLEGVFMHFADAGDRAYSLEQLSRFAAACAALEDAGAAPLLRHAASSAAAVLHPESRLDMIRPGAGVYGYLSPVRARAGIDLRPAMSWRSSIAHLKDYPAGHSLGYNRTFATRRPTRIAVLPLGYGDGYRREFSNRAFVLVRGRRTPVAGVVSMDYTMIDVTGIDGLRVGTTATLLGRDGDDAITAEELAEWGGTIPYCVTTGVGSRLGRIYAAGSGALPETL